MNPVAPTEFFVTNRGFLVTLDNWHNMGFGKVAVFYSAEGLPLRSYELADLFVGAEVDGFQHSASSIWWRRTNETCIRLDQDTLRSHQRRGRRSCLRSSDWQISILRDEEWKLSL
jgi:hypothetical protein